MPRVIKDSTLTSKSQITIPKKIREAVNLKPGDQVTFKIGKNEITIIPVPSLLGENFGKVRPAKKPEDFKKIRRKVTKEVGLEVSKEYR